MDLDLDNFQTFDSTSQYGSASLAEDTASVVSGYTANTSRRQLADELESLAIAEEPARRSRGTAGEEDFEGVLDELKEDGQVDLPPHACRYASPCL